MALAAAVLAFLLLVSLVDHWILDLGMAGRWIALLLLAAFVVFFFFFQIAPLLLHKINPLYAARAIEEGTPALKNSLINFLQLRRQRASVHQLVYRVVERQAATGLCSTVRKRLERRHHARPSYL